ncbi:MAG: hypothetical protein JSU92_02985 [Deltaproteobacteria bacterium]|nr:MAG: hypothetical protein JSU92_02985 [Deltaproteobacteria bacterium]
MKKSGLIAVSLFFALSLLTACGVGMGGGAGDTQGQPDLEELIGTINELEVKVGKLERENETLQDILSTVTEHLLVAEEDIADLTGNIDINVGALADRLTTAEGDIAAHDGRLTTAEGSITTIQGTLTAIGVRLSTVEANNALLLNPYLSVETGPINSLSGPHVILTGINLHVRSGGGSTGAVVNGLGNLLVGYNEEPFSLDPGDRGGSHNLIVGPYHSYSSYGGFLAGYRNTVSTRYASVSGGNNNNASGQSSSISGGRYNTASGAYSSVSGGETNTTSGYASSVSGGRYNWASGWCSSVSGGLDNFALGDFSSVSGGYNHIMISDYGWMACGGYTCFDVVP